MPASLNKGRSEWNPIQMRDMKNLVFNYDNHQLTNLGTALNWTLVKYNECN